MSMSKGICQQFTTGLYLPLNQAKAISQNRVRNRNISLLRNNSFISTSTFNNATSNTKFTDAYKSSYCDFMKKDFFTLSCEKNSHKDIKNSRTQGITTIGNSIKYVSSTKSTLNGRKSYVFIECDKPACRKKLSRNEELAKTVTNDFLKAITKHNATSKDNKMLTSTEITFNNTKVIQRVLLISRVKDMLRYRTNYKLLKRRNERNTIPLETKAKVLCEKYKNLYDRIKEVSPSKYSTKIQGLNSIKKINKSSLNIDKFIKKFVFTKLLPRPKFDKINAYIGSSNRNQQNNKDIGVSNCNQSALEEIRKVLRKEFPMLDSQINLVVKYNKDSYNILTYGI